MEHENIISCFEVLQLVSDQNTGLVFEMSPDTISEQMLAHSTVHGTQRIIQKYNISIRIHGSSKSEGMAKSCYITNGQR